jgi:YVTN family beta-propeller protein
MRLVFLAVLVASIAGVADAEYVVDSVTTGNGPVAMAVNPITNRIYVANVNSSDITVVDGATDSAFQVSADSEPWAVAVNPTTNKIYVANYGSADITVIDGVTNGVTTVSVGLHPCAVAVNPATNQVYVANQGDSNVTVIDGATNATRTIATGAEPSAVAVNAATNRIYVANYNHANQGSVTIINGSTDSTTSAGAGVAPIAVAVNPVTNRIYVANYQSPNIVTVIDGATGDSVASVITGNQPHCIAVDPVANKIYVACVFGNCVSVIDGATNAVSTVVTANQPGWLALNPVTNRVYVANQYDVSVIDGATQVLTIVAGYGSAPALAVNPVTNRLYVADGMLFVIDGATNVATTVAAGVNPCAVSSNPVTNKIYVANSASNDVTVIDGADNSTQTVTAGANPCAVVVNPVTNRAYATNPGSNSVTVIDGATHDTTTVAVGSGPRAVAANPVTNKIYVANFNCDTVTVIDGATNATQTVAVGIYPGAVAVNPVTNRIYVGNSGTGSNSVIVIDGATNVVQTVTVGSDPHAVAVNPVTNRIYVANNAGNSVSVIDGASNTVVATPAVGIHPQAVAVNPVTNKVYVANYNSSVSVIDGASSTVIATPSVGPNPIALAVNPVTNKVYVANGSNNSVTVIDGATNSAQTMTVGSICAAVAVNPVTSIVYVANGSSTVTVFSEAPASDTRVTAVMNLLAGDTTSRSRPTLSGKGVNRSSPGRTVMLAVGNRLNTAQEVWNKAGVLSGAGTDSLTWVFDWGSDSLIAGENFIVLQPLESDAGSTNNQGLGTPFAGNRTVLPIYRLPSGFPPDSNWTPQPPVPEGPKHKTVKAGGCVASDGLGNLYLLKGNGTCEFYHYDSARDTWYTGDSIPAIDPDGKKRPVKKGASMAVAGGRVYVFKGGRSTEYWQYNPGAVDGTWSPVTSVPIMSSSSQASDGATYVYLLGYDSHLKTAVFTRTSASNGFAEPLTPPLPHTPGSSKTFKTGSCIVYYPDDKLSGHPGVYALQLKTDDLYRYDIGSKTWTWLNANMPIVWPGTTAKKPAGAGAGMAYAPGNKIIYALTGNNSLYVWAYSANNNAWTSFIQVPPGPHGKKVKDGGGISCVSGSLFVVKGNNTQEYYSMSSSLWKDQTLTPGASLQSAGSNASSVLGLTVTPNPAARDARVSFSLPRAGSAELKLYDAAGKLVGTLASGYHPAGEYSYSLPTALHSLASGVYVLKLETDGRTTTRKLIVE